MKDIHTGLLQIMGGLLNSLKKNPLQSIFFDLNAFILARSKQGFQDIEETEGSDWRLVLA